MAEPSGREVVSEAQRAPLGTRRRRSLARAARAAAILLGVQAVAQPWAVSVSGLTMPLRAAILASITALGVALLASLSLLCLRVGPRWAIAGLVAWTAGWVANTAAIGSLAVVALGRPLPAWPKQLDVELVQILATAGGLVVGAALVAALREPRFRHSAIVLLVGYAIFGVVAATAQHRIELAMDFPRIAALRADRERAGAIMAFALAGVLWLYGRSVAGLGAPRATAEGRRGDSDACSR